MVKHPDQIIGRFKNGTPIYADGDAGYGTIYCHASSQMHDQLIDASMVEDDSPIERRIEGMRLQRFPGWTVRMHKDAADAYGQWLAEGAEKDYPADQIPYFEAAQIFHQVCAHLTLGE